MKLVTLHSSTDLQDWAHCSMVTSYGSEFSTKRVFSSKQESSAFKNFTMKIITKARAFIVDKW